MALVEPRVTMEQLVDAFLPVGLLPPGHPPLPQDITVERCRFRVQGSGFRVHREEGGKRDLFFFVLEPHALQLLLLLAPAPTSVPDIA